MSIFGEFTWNIWKLSIREISRFPNVRPMSRMLFGIFSWEANQMLVERLCKESTNWLCELPKVTHVVVVTFRKDLPQWSLRDVICERFPIHSIRIIKMLIIINIFNYSTISFNYYRFLNSIYLYFISHSNRQIKIRNLVESYLVL